MDDTPRDPWGIEYTLRTCSNGGKNDGKQFWVQSNESVIANGKMWNPLFNSFTTWGGWVEDKTLPTRTAPPEGASEAIPADKVVSSINAMNSTAELNTKYVANMANDIKCLSQKMDAMQLSINTTHNLLSQFAEYMKNRMGQ